MHAVDVNADADRREELERRFRRAGLPLFVEGFSATTEVFNRVVPLLGIVALGETLGAIQLNWSLAANIAAALGGLAILLACVGLVNRAGGRSFFSVPRRVGRTELAAFVLVPALLPLIFGGQIGSAAATAAANLALLALIYGVVGYGLVAIVRWALARLASQLAGSLTLIARAVPLLAIFALLSFTSQEMWQIFSSVTSGVFIVILGLFIALGTAFLAARIPREARALERDAGAQGPPLNDRQRFNVGLVMFVSQALQVLIVSLVIGVFFAAFGLLAVDESVRTQWTGSAGHVLVTLRVLGERFEITQELLRVSAGLAAFSGFYFAIAMLTDSTYREEFLETVTSEMRASFNARAEYLKLLTA
jgi:ABC-type arginine transport system permease subunit